MKFIIDRSTWCRSVLCDGKGSKCALGQYYSALGVSDELLLLGSIRSQEVAALGHRGDWQIMSANDVTGYMAETREARITKLFALRGVECLWEGEYAA